MMNSYVCVIFGCIIGGLAVWWATRGHAGVAAAAAEASVKELRLQVAEARTDFETLHRSLADAEARRASAEARADAIDKSLAEQRTLLEESKGSLKEAFESLASEALRHNNTSFLDLAEEKFKGLHQHASGDLTERQRAIAELVDPLTRALERYQQEARTLEEKRANESGQLGQQLSAITHTQAALQKETTKLANALSSPTVRGRWGEIALRRTAELSGMSMHCDFVEQHQVTTEEGALRPDMIVQLPAGRQVVVDAKVSWKGFEESLGAVTDDGRDAALRRHAALISEHVKKLAAKEYWSQFPQSPEFVVLFIPNDSFLAAAAEKDAMLVEVALERKVMIATPTTFIALLRAIEYGWRQERVAENAQRVSELGQEIAERIATLAEHFNRVGGALGKAVESFNAASSSLESRVLISARKFKELGAGGKKDIEEVAMIEQSPRSLASAKSSASDA